MNDRLLLIHSPLVGPTTWLPVSDALKRGGCQTIVPRLTEHLDGGPPYYERLAACVASEVDAAAGSLPLAVITHSGAGALVPSIVDACPVPVSAVIFVDAILPHPGKCLLETVPTAMAEDLRARASAGRLPPWSDWFPSDMIAALLPDDELRGRFLAELPRLPIGYLEEPAPDAQSWQSRCCGYLHLSPLYASAADSAETMGWLTRRYPSDHLAMLTQPREIADIVHWMVDQLS